MAKSVSSIVNDLKTQHLTLMVVSLALFSSVILGQPTDNIEKAKKDILAIEKMVENWDPQFAENPGWRGIFSADYEGNGLQSWDVSLDVPVNKQTKFDSELILVTSLMKLPDWEHEEYGSKLNVRPPITVQEFEELWNKSMAIEFYNIHNLKNYAYVQVGRNEPVEKMTLKYATYLLNDETSAPPAVFCRNIFDTEKVESADASLIGLAFSQDCFSKQTGAKGDDFMSAYPKIWIPSISTSERPKDGTYDLCYQMGWPDTECNYEKPFEQAFPSLYLVTKNLQDIPFQNVLLELDNQILSDNRNFEFLGLSLPIGRLRNLGSALLSILLLNFYIHLHELNVQIKKGSVEFETAWMGLFSNNLARILAYVTLSVLPASYILFTTFQSLKGIYREWASAPQLLVAFGFWFIALFLPVLFLLEFLEIWKKLDAYKIARKPYKNSIRRKNRN